MSDQCHPLRAGLKDDKLFSFHFWGVMLPHNTVSLVNWVLKHSKQHYQQKYFILSESLTDKQSKMSSVIPLSSDMIELFSRGSLACAASLKCQLGQKKTH